jgi:outer membrane receptor for ferrienterochelin and colicins
MPQRSTPAYSRPKRGVAKLVLLAVFCTGSVAAQQSGQADLSGQSMESLLKMKVESVYGATKFLQKSEDASTTLITVVTDEEIQKYGYRTLADVLRAVRGFYVINDRNFSSAGYSNGG